MVLPGSIITVRLDAARETDEGRYLFFSVLAESGAPAIKGGVALIS
jgi:hypothetical protein